MSDRKTAASVANYSALFYSIGILVLGCRLWRKKNTNDIKRLKETAFDTF